MIDFLNNRELSDLWCDPKGKLHRTGQFKITDEIRAASPSKVPSRVYLERLTWADRIRRLLRGNRGTR